MKSLGLIYLPYPVRIASPLDHLLQSTWNVKLSNDIFCIPHSKGRVKCHTHLHSEVACGCYAVWMILKPAATSRSHDYHVTSFSFFVQRVGNLGFPIPKFKFPPLSFADFLPHIHITFISQEHLVPYLAVSKSLGCTKHCPCHCLCHTSWWMYYWQWDSS